MRILGTMSVSTKVCLIHARVKGDILINVTQKVRTIEMKTTAMIIPVGVPAKVPMVIAMMTLKLAVLVQKLVGAFHPTTNWDKTYPYGVYVSTSLLHYSRLTLFSCLLI